MTEFKTKRFKSLSCINIARKMRNFGISRFLDYKNVEFKSTPLFKGKWPDITNEGSLILGSNCGFRALRIQSRITVRKNACLEFGNETFVNEGVTICATESITIGHNVLIGSMSRIYDTDFHQVSPDKPLRKSPISIGNNVWIAVNVIILPGVNIGDHCVIAAGSIVNRSIPGKSLAAGCPAKVIKTLNIPDDWVRK